MTLKFNISASALNEYYTSPLTFYFNKILKKEPDTEVIQIYGKSGSVMHNCLESFIKGEVEEKDLKQFFEKQWSEYSLDVETGFNGKVLGKSKYWNSVKLGVMKLKNIYNDYKLLAEGEYIFPFIISYEEDIKIYLKGYIDLLCVKDDEILMVDWKSSSSDSGDFSLQAKMYFLLYYLKHDKVPSKIVFEYLKIGKKKEYSYTVSEIKFFYEEVKSLTKNIIKNADNIDFFDAGEWDNPFNVYKENCKSVVESRKKAFDEEALKIIISGGELFFKNLPSSLEDLFLKKYSYYVEGYNHTKLFKKGLWDGKKRLYNKHKSSLPLGLLSDVVELINDYNNYTDKSLPYVIEDTRMNSGSFNVNTYKKSDKELRYYQLEAVEKIFKEKIGILALSTGAGKTIIGSEIIRRVNGKVLFLVNRLELLNQTVSVFEEELGCKVGVVGEGDMDLRNVTVATIQTVHSILKRRDETSKELVDFLEDVNCCIYDEAQWLKDSGSYGFMSKLLKNSFYRVGLTGTPFRNYKPETIEMNSLVGKVVYSKNTSELVKEGFLVPTKCFFIKHDNGLSGLSYQEEYRLGVVENDERNNVIVKLVEEFVGKKVLIVTRRVEHAKVLGSLIGNSKVITGSTGKVIRKSDFEDFKSSDGDVSVLIGSSQIFSTGVDVPSLDCIINAVGGKSDVEIIQLIGRVMRKSVGKEHGYYFDFVDSSRYLKKASGSRKKILKSFGHEIKTLNMYSEVYKYI